MMCKIERASHFCVAIKTVMPKGAPRAVDTGRGSGQSFGFRRKRNIEHRIEVST